MLFVAHEGNGLTHIIFGMPVYEIVEIEQTVHQHHTTIIPTFPLLPHFCQPLAITQYRIKELPVRVLPYPLTHKVCAHQPHWQNEYTNSGRENGE